MGVHLRAFGATADNLRVNGWLANRSSLACRVSEGWRRRPDLNRGWRFCRPLPYLLATAPHEGRKTVRLRACGATADNLRERLARQP